MEQRRLYGGETGRTIEMVSAVQNMMQSPERPRVLIAEDQDDVIAALRLLLKSNGYDVEFVKSPAEALKALRNHSFDAVLLDLNYSRDTTSGTEGLELLSNVQALDDTLAVVVMTAWGSVKLAVDAMHRGACDFVQKPWDNAELLNVLQQQMKRSRVLREKRRKENFEQQEAAQVQRSLMPSDSASHAGLSIVASSQSARAVGGDYYDVVDLGNNQSAICIGDVMGKGVSAALLMSNLQARVRTLAQQAAEPKDLCQKLNAVLSANSLPGKFITFFYCVIDSARKQICFTNAGHNWPILMHADGSCERLGSADSVLGGFKNWEYHQEQSILRAGDRLVLFTDGITECLNEEGREFGEDTLVKITAENVHLPATELKNKLLEAIGGHCQGTFDDDATLIVVGVE